MAEADLSKVINLIMENPSLIEQIRSMVSDAEQNEDKESESKSDATPPPSPETKDTYAKSHASKRNDLLRAIRPYLSEERAKAIESMITIADILSVAKKET